LSFNSAQTSGWIRILPEGYKFPAHLIPDVLIS
jgi:hypothetical protein